MSLTGHPGGPPTRVGTSVGDITAGLFTAVGIAAALHRRHATGRGTLVDVGMLDCQIAILENAIARYFATGAVPGPMGARHPSITPFEAYATADGHIIVAAGNDGLFARLAAALGRPDLTDDPRFATNDARTTHVAALKETLEGVLAGGTTAAWLETIGAAGVPCGPINDVAQALADPQVQARTMVIEALGGSGNPDGAPMKMAGNPIKLAGVEDPATRTAAPDLDADRAAILAALGMG
jgi:CoA:oxalate CoA-transferase